MLQMSNEELESLFPEIEKKTIATLEKFICLIYEEINSSHLTALTGSSFIATSDNIVQWMLNSNSSNIISTWFKLNAKTQNILKYTLLINGVLSTTAIDLYASSNLIKNVMQTLRRLKIIPDYKSWFYTVIITSVLISIFGVSGAAGLTFNLYASSLVRAILFSLTTVFVTLFTSTFFFHSQLDTLRRYYLSTREDRNNELLILKTVFSSFTHNLSNLAPEEFDCLKKELEKFYKNTNRTHHDICHISDLLRPLFKPFENQRNQSHNESSCESMTISKYLPPIIFAIFATWLYYGVGSVSIETFLHNLNKKSPVILNILVGSCMGIIAGITVCYSINQFIPSNIRNNLSDFCSQPAKQQLITLGKAILQLIISSLAALAVINLVDIANNNRSSSFKQIVSVFALIQQTLVVANCILQTSPKEFMENLYIDISRLFIKNVKAEQKRAIDNIQTLSTQMELASKDDLEILNNSLRKLNLI